MRSILCLLVVSPIVASIACSGSTVAQQAPIDGGVVDSTSSSDTGGGSTDTGAATDSATHVDTGPADAGSAADACTALAAALCSRISACSPFALGAIYGDVSTCEARQSLQCLATLGASQTGATVAVTEACTAALPTMACAVVDTGKLTGPCATAAGTIDNGTACGDDAQCSSTFCARGPAAVCGKCATPTAAGDGCVDGACSTGQVCLSTGTCANPVPGKVGDSCTSQTDCDLANAVGCNTSSGKCFKLTLASGSCGVDSIFTPTSFAVCPGSGTCSAVSNGTCSPAAADGATCSTGTSGPSCLPPARCVSGKCSVPRPRPVTDIARARDAHPRVAAAICTLLG